MSHDDIGRSGIGRLIAGRRSVTSGWRSVLTIDPRSVRTVPDLRGSSQALLALFSGGLVEFIARDRHLDLVYCCLDPWAFSSRVRSDKLFASVVVVTTSPPVLVWGVAFRCAICTPLVSPLSRNSASSTTRNRLNGGTCGVRWPLRKEWSGAPAGTSDRARCATAVHQRAAASPPPLPSGLRSNGGNPHRTGRMHCTTVLADVSRNWRRACPRVARVLPPCGACPPRRAGRQLQFARHVAPEFCRR